MSMAQTYHYMTSSVSLLALVNPLRAMALLTAYIATPMKCAITPLCPPLQPNIVASPTTQAITAINACARAIAIAFSCAGTPQPRIGIAEVGRFLQEHEFLMRREATLLTMGGVLRPGPRDELYASTVCVSRANLQRV